MDGLVVYTERHLSRLDRLVRSTYLLDYTLASMKVGVCRGRSGGRQGQEMEAGEGRVVARSGKWGWEWLMCPGRH